MLPDNCSLDCASAIGPEPYHGSNYNVTGLEPYTVYSYTITAVNPAGCSVMSDSLESRTNEGSEFVVKQNYLFG